MTRDPTADAEQRTTVLYESALAQAADPDQDRAERLRRAAALLDEALEIAPRDQDLHGRVAITSADIAGQLFAETGDRRVLQRWLAQAERWSEEIGWDDWRAPLYLLARGVLLYRMSLVTGDADHVDATIQTLETARESAGARSGITATSSAFLADILLHRYDSRVDPTDLEQAVQSAWRAATHDRSNQQERFIGVVTLATALVRRYKLTRSREDLLDGVRFGEQAVELAETAHDLGRAHETRGIACRHLYGITGEQAHLDEALASFEYLAGKVAADDEIHAAALDSYANCLMDRYQLTGNEEDLSVALSASREALALATEESPTRVVVLGNLAVCLVARYDRAGAVADLEEAIALLRSALDDVDRTPTEEFVLWARLAAALARRAAGSTSLDLLDDALAAFREVDSRLDRPSELPVDYALGRQRSYGRLPEHHVGALLRRANRAPRDERRVYLARLLDVSERAKSRLLTDVAEYASLSPPEEVPDDLAQWERSLLTELDHIGAIELAATGTAVDSDRLKLLERRRGVRRHLEEAWDEMAGISDAAADYVAIRRGAGKPLLSTLDSGDPDTAFLALTAAQGFAASDRRPQPQLVAVAYRPGWPEPVVVGSEPGADPIPEAVRRFSAEVPGDLGLGLRAETWHQSLVKLLRPVVEALGDAGRIVVSPPEHGLNLPWHLLLERCGRPPGSPVVTTPSLALLTTPSTRRGYPVHFVRDDDPERAAQRLFALVTHAANDIVPAPLVVGNPTGDLPAAVREAEQVASILGTDPLLGEAATVDAVRQAVELAPVAHFAAHARFDEGSPLDSQIQLADGALPSRTLLEVHTRAELVVLSACESGVGGTLAGADIMGLAHALLRAGTRAVVASLWPVDDDSTAFLMGEFYRNRAEGSPDADALAAATVRTRARPEWSSPYYWSGFVVTQRGDAR